MYVDNIDIYPLISLHPSKMSTRPTMSTSKLKEKERMERDKKKERQLKECLEAELANT